jgi:hypothetical protein
VQGISRNFQRIAHDIGCPETRVEAKLGPHRGTHQEKNAAGAHDPFRSDPATGTKESAGGVDTCLRR